MDDKLDTKLLIPAHSSVSGKPKKGEDKTGRETCYCGFTVKLHVLNSVENAPVLSIVSMVTLK